MRVRQLEWSAERGWLPEVASPESADLILFFAGRPEMAEGQLYGELRTRFPEAQLVGCSTGGQFDRARIETAGGFALALAFDRATCRVASAPGTGSAVSFLAGRMLGNALAAPDLRAVLVLSDGLNVNGSELVRGIATLLPKDVTIAGGLAGDGANFAETLVAANAVPQAGMVAAIGLYGDSVRCATGSAGGWDVFGPRRLITRAEGNVLFELDGEPALDLYERYLGPEDAASLPGSGLLYPLRIEDPERAGSDVVRTILAIDRAARSLTFAGDMPVGHTAQLMRGNFDRLTDGAAQAAHQANPDGSEPGLALLVSCIGRRLLMGQRALDEVEAAAAALPPSLAVMGFYSYGEISPQAQSGFCELHNQTMTVFTLTEAKAA